MKKILMKISIICTLLLTTLSFISCGFKSSNVQTINSGDKSYSVDIPKNWNYDGSMGKNSLLIYDNSKKHDVAIMCDDKKLMNKLYKDFNGYKDANEKMLNTEEYNNYSKKDEKDIKINKLKGTEYVFTGDADGINYKGKVVYLESDSHYFVIMPYTVANEYDDYKNDFETIVKSINEA